MRRTELFLFESRYGRDVFTAKVGAPAGLVRVVHNGVTAQEFAELTPQADATDIVFVGELRMLKGVDVLLDALAQLARERPVTATIVGDGPDAAQFRAQAERLGLFVRRSLPAADAGARCLQARPAVRRAVTRRVPSPTSCWKRRRCRADDHHNVGGIPEIFGPQAAGLVAPGNVEALARSISAALIEIPYACVTKH